MSSASPTTGPRIPPAPSAPPPPPEQPGRAAPPREIPFWQQPHVVDVVSFATSLVLHLSIIVLGLVGFKTYQDVTQRPVEQAIIPDSTIVENAPIGGVPNPGLGGDPDRAAAQDQVRDVAAASSDSWKNQRGDSLTQSIMGDAGGEAAADTAIAPGPRAGLGPTKGSGTGTGEAGGSPAPFGVPGGGGGAGPKANFFGQSGNAHKVAFVCDASGSMLDTMFALKLELRKSIDPLKPMQFFNVIFFADKEKPQAISPKGDLIAANADNKRKSYDFLNTITTAGATNPIPGLDLAFRGKPELIYLLTDGNFPNNEAVLARIRDLNAQKKTKINTFLFCDAANIEPGIAELLKQIADENGGNFKIIDTKDF